MDSEVKLRATVMSTMEPEEMSGGSKMEGNSICDFEVFGQSLLRFTVTSKNDWRRLTYESFIWSEEDSDAGVDLADCQRDKHFVDPSVCAQLVEVAVRSSKYQAR